MFKARIHFRYANNLKVLRNNILVHYNYILPGFTRFPNFKFYSIDKPEQPVAPTSAEDLEDQEKRAKAWKRMKLSLIIMGSCFTFLGFYSFYTFGKYLSTFFTVEGPSYQFIHLYRFSSQR